MIKTGIVRKRKPIYKEAMTVYELHFGSWKRKKMEHYILTGNGRRTHSVCGGTSIYTY